MPQVQLPDSFFKKERDTIYSDWHLELFRELFQNSLDAGATEIAIHINRDGGMANLQFMDNGCGMTREVLENVYFRLGETTKTGSQVGGFGRARILTNFSMDKYEIITLDNKVSGAGANYEVETLCFSDRVQGCHQDLWTSDADIYDLRRGLDDFASRCQFKIPVTLDGELIGKDKYLVVDDYYVRSMKNEEDQAIASIFYLPPEKAPFRGMAVIRVNGSFMFQCYVGCEGLVVIELEPSFSRVMLNASRNSFQNGYDRQFQEIMALFSQNEKTASERTFVDDLHMFQGSGAFFFTKDTVRLPKTAKSSKGIFKKSIPILVEDLHQALANNSVPKYTSSKRANSIRLEGTKEIGFVSYVGDWLPDVFVRVRTSDVDLKRLAESWNPGIWKFVVRGDTANFGEHSHKLSLLNVWKEAIFCSMEALFKLNPNLELVWSPGFLISSNSTEAIHEEYNGRHRFMLNPYNKDKAIRFSMSSEESLREILAIAKHEVAHAVFPSHSENYSIVHTGIDKILDQRDSLIRMKNVRV